MTHTAHTAGDRSSELPSPISHLPYVGFALTLLDLDGTIPVAAVGDTPTRLPILSGSSLLYLPMWRLWSFAVGLVVEMKQAEKMPLIPQGGDILPVERLRGSPTMSGRMS